ncbi:hypothetical protein RUM44_009301 [Polyplax serrata]|uniref:Anosmin-1 n=1 Tax=Polyplax serrata TaxID=468196 RepID=A0ABR1ASA6_POLSC
MREGRRFQVICLLILSLSEWTESKEKRQNRFEGIQGSDSVQVTRCDVVCFYEEDKEECHKECMGRLFQKFGQCPERYDNLPVFVQACVYFCLHDSDCPSTEKCCGHSCGQTCKPASDLLGEKYLPPVPLNLTARERKCKRRHCVHLTWDFTPRDRDQLVLFVLEERHHLGPFYNEPLLGEWNPIDNSRKKSINLKNFIKPGYWYQFRVAAVNSNGTRGFSTESDGFKLAGRPKLQEPTKLRVVQVKEKNETIWGLVRWNASESSIPIQRYKIFWSRKLNEKDFNYNSETVLVQADVVPANQLYYQLKNLNKNTEYFIQVQALAFYGKKTLKSRMAEMIFPTSKPKDQYDTEYS